MGRVQKLNGVRLHLILQAMESELPSSLKLNGV